MAKIRIEEKIIRNCYQCGDYERGEDYIISCSRTGLKITGIPSFMTPMEVLSKEPIPGWCPLPDKEE